MEILQSANLGQVQALGLEASFAVDGVIFLVVFGGGRRELFPEMEELKV